MKISIILLLLSMSLCAQLRVGDPGVTFDETKFDSRYPEMKEWQNAGVEGGIPWLSDTPVKKTIDATDSDGINAAINTVAASGGGQLLLRNGTYSIDKTVTVKSKVRIVGESRDGVILQITLRGDSGSAVHFAGAKNAGIENLTLIGDGDGTPPDFEMRDAMPDFIITSVYFGGSSKNCWIDKCNLINSGSNAISIWNSYHITVRDCYIERSYNKGSGGHGYVQFSGESCLMVNTVIKKMRHIILQREYCKYNVMYKNNVEQDFNFHNADAGYNLIEGNTVRLPAGLGDNWHAMMTPWSVQHSPPGPGNVIYRNDCIEYNNGGAVDFSDPDKIWIPVDHYQVFDISTETPVGKTFYPVNNVVDETGVDQQAPSTLPASVKLIGNYPNPFNPATTIRYSLTAAQDVKLYVCDTFGRIVQTVVDQYQDAGHYEIKFDAREMTTGVYVFTLKTSNFNLSKRMLVLK